MTLHRWSIAFLQLGVLLVAIGGLPILFMMVFAPQANFMLPELLGLTVAPLGALVLAVGVIAWATARFRG